MGLAFQSISVFNATPFFNTLISQGKVRDEQFAFYLAESESELYLGGVNTARYKGPFNWVPVTQEVRSIRSSDAVGADILLLGLLAG